MDEFNLYVDDITEITDPIEKLLDKIRTIEEEKDKLASENKKLKTANKQQLDKISSIEKENKKLKTANKQQLDKISSIEKENKELKTANKQSGDNNSQKTRKTTNRHSMIEVLSNKTNQKVQRIEPIDDDGLADYYQVTLPVNYTQKVLKGDKKIYYEEMKHLILEYEILKYLNHPNIIQTFGLFLGDKNNSPYILHQYIPYNLNDHIKSIDKEQKVRVILEICSAMEAVHKANLIHLDLKPKNILIDEDKHAHLTGFYLSIYNDKNTEKPNGVGTIAFMAPEVMGEEEYDEKADVYSFGTVLLFILSGKMHFSKYFNE